MLRLGLTGNLGSGKSTVAALLAARGASVIASDVIGRDLMQPNEAVYDQIVALFGPEVLAAGGALDRSALARIAFSEGRSEELNAIVHPAVIARQAVIADDFAERQPEGVLVVESALIFETRFGSTGGPRFDRIVLVTAPEREKIARFVHRQHPSGALTRQERESLEAEARRRLALQLPDSEKAIRCDYVLTNDGSLDHLKAQVETLWPTLLGLAQTGGKGPAKSLQ